MTARTRMACVGWTIAGAYMAAAIAACDIDPDPADRPDELDYRVRDSAGITIVESGRPAPDSRLGWQVGAAPQLSLGAAIGEADYQLYEVGDATRLADGRFVVANGGSNQLLAFDAAGNYLAAWAGQGDGPGEFRSLARVAYSPGDSVLAGNSRDGRASFFDIDGTHGRTTMLQGSPGPFMRAMGREQDDHIVIDVLPDGSLFTKTTEGYETTGFWRWQSAYALMTADGGTTAALGEYPGPEIYSENVFAEEQRMVYVTPLRHPFGKSTFTAVWGDLVAFGRNEAYEIRAFSSDGSLARIVRRDYVPGAPTQEQQDAHFRERFADLSDDERTSRLGVAANVPMVETFPAYAGIEGDALGYLWVREFERPGDESENPVWTVFDPEGRALGFVETPSGLTIYEIGEDYILGKRTGELDIESVELWGLTRTEGD